LGYVLFEIPSNLILARVGARVWLSRILVSWGLATVALALSAGPTSFAILRFFLGVAEGGFFTVRASLPKTPGGKISRKALRQEQ